MSRLQNQNIRNGRASTAKTRLTGNVAVLRQLSGTVVGECQSNFGTVK